MRMIARAVIIALLVAKVVLRGSAGKRTVQEGGAFSNDCSVARPLDTIIWTPLTVVQMPSIVSATVRRFHVTMLPIRLLVFHPLFSLSDFI